MRPLRSRVLTAILFAILTLGIFGTAANAADLPTTNCFPQNPWAGLGNSLRANIFPEDSWPGLGNSIRRSSFPEDPWPGLD